MKLGISGHITKTFIHFASDTAFTVSLSCGWYGRPRDVTA